MNIKKWEVYWANVKFEDSEKCKKRPVLVVNITKEVILCFKLTSVYRGDNPPEYVLKDWKSVGLSKETYLRQDKFLRLKEENLISKIGMLSFLDIFRLEQRLCKR